MVGIAVSISHPSHDPDGHHRAQRRVVQFAAVDQALNILPSRLKDVRHEFEGLGVVALSGECIRPPLSEPGMCRPNDCAARFPSNGSKSASRKQRLVDNAN